MTISTAKPDKNATDAHSARRTRFAGPPSAISAEVYGLSRVRVYCVPMRTLLTLLLALSLLPVAIFAHQAATTREAGELELSAIRGEYQRAIDDFRQQYTAAKTKEERIALEPKQPQMEDYLPRVMRLAETYPRTSAARDALMWVTQGNFRDVSAVAPAFEILARDFATDRHVINQMVPGLRWQPSPGAQQLLEAVIEQNQDPSVKAKATLALGASIKYEAEILEQSMSAVAAREPRELQKRFANGSEILEKDRARAAEMLDRVINDYADVENGKYAKLARAELFRMRDLVVGKPAPEITGVSLDGNPMKLSDYRGKVVVLDFFGDW